MSLTHQMPYEWLIGLRYTRAGRRSGRNSFISFISLISVAGIGLGVAALIVVLSIMNGFRKDVTDRMLSVLAHIEVLDSRGAMPDWRATLQDSLKNPAVLAGAPFVQSQGMLLRDGAMRPALIRGVLPSEEPKVSEVAKSVRQGSLDALRPGEFNIVLGYALARSLGLQVGDKVTMALAKAQVTPAGMLPRMRTFTLVGLFQSSHYEFDNGMAFVHLEDAQKMERLDAPSGIRLRVADIHQAPQVADQLQAGLPAQMHVLDWSKQNKTWFAAVQTEKKMMLIVMTLIITVAAFNLVSTLVMTVTEKQADIAILRTLGSSPRSIMKIFVIQGALVGILGALAGVGLGVLVSLNIETIVPFFERLAGGQILSSEIYQTSALPSDLHWSDVLGIGGIAILMAFLATIYPSFAASRVKPAEALRYE
ncbi:MAG: lipoprotein-releasing ABC transporter permease subunit [Pseudomonadota bacterium]